MDFISSISFPNEPLISWTFLSHFCPHFWVCSTAKQQQIHQKVMTKMVKKCSTDQRFIWKRNTTSRSYCTKGFAGQVLENWGVIQIMHMYVIEGFHFYNSPVMRTWVSFREIVHFGNLLQWFWSMKDRGVVQITLICRRVAIF